MSENNYEEDDSACPLEVEGDLDSFTKRSELRRIIRYTHAYHVRPLKRDVRALKEIVAEQQKDILRWKTIAIVIGTVFGGIPLVLTTLPLLLKMFSAIK